MGVLQNVIREDRRLREPVVGFFEGEAEDSGGDSVFGVSLQE